MKKYLIIISAIVLAGATWLFSVRPEPPFVGGVKTEAQLLNQISTAEEKYKSVNGKYINSYMETVVDKGTFPYDFVINDYVAPDGPGYQIIITKMDTPAPGSPSQEALIRFTKSIANGPEAIERTWDWKP